MNVWKVTRLVVPLAIGLFATDANGDVFRPSNCPYEISFPGPFITKTVNQYGRSYERAEHTEPGLYLAAQCYDDLAVTSIEQFMKEMEADAISHGVVVRQWFVDSRRVGVMIGERNVAGALKRFRTEYHITAQSVFLVVVVEDISRWL